MVIVSAGVVMNVILAALGFMYIFSVGFLVPKPTIGGSSFILTTLSRQSGWR